MSKIHLYGKDYEVYEKDTLERVDRNALVASLAKVVLLQTPDRKEAHLVFMGSGGEAYALAGPLTRVNEDTAEFLRAFLTVVEADKK